MYPLKENKVKDIEVGDIVISFGCMFIGRKPRKSYVVLKGNKNVTEHEYVLADLDTYVIKEGFNSLEEIESQYMYLCTSGKGVKENE